MFIFRNPETLQGAIVLLALSALLTGLGFTLGPAGGLYGAAVSAALCTVFYWITRRRYKRIAAMCDEIDRILDGRDAIDLEAFAEGELSVLQTEVSKMTLRLRQQTELLEKDKLFLADSLADISHQLKTPLTSIHLAVAMLGEPELSTERRAALLWDVSRSLGRIEWLVSSLLKISRLDAGTVTFQREPVEARALVRRAAEPLEAAMDLRDQRFVCDVPEDITLTGDFPWLTEAVGNLLKNCMEHTPEGGTITVRARENALFTELTVSDTGEGFAQEDLPHLFERFYRGKNADEQSVGIGLALSRMIVTSLGGTLKAENGRGGGALFTMRFYKSTV